MAKPGMAAQFAHAHALKSLRPFVADLPGQRLTQGRSNRHLVTNHRTRKQKRKATSPEHEMRPLLSHKEAPVTRCNSILVRKPPRDTNARRTAPISVRGAQRTSIHKQGPHRRRFTPPRQPRTSTPEPALARRRNSPGKAVTASWCTMKRAVAAAGCSAGAAGQLASCDGMASAGAADEEPHRA